MQASVRLVGFSGFFRKKLIDSIFGQVIALAEILDALVFHTIDFGHVRQYEKPTRP